MREDAGAALERRTRSLAEILHAVHKFRPPLRPHVLTVQTRSDGVRPRAEASKLSVKQVVRIGPYQYIGILLRGMTTNAPPAPC